MATALTDLLVPTHRQRLRTLAGLLDRAREQRPDAAEELLAARLAPDMPPLAAPIRCAAFQAQAAVYRLTGQALPGWLVRVAAEGRDVRDRPGTVAEEKARLERALARLDALEPAALDGGAALAIAPDRPDGLAFDLTGEACARDWARDWARPQFYFHVVSACAILRNRGIAIGEAGSVPHMLAYRRAGGAQA